MSSAAATAESAPARRRINLRAIGIALTGLVVAAIALDTTYKKPGETTATGQQAFDPAAYGAETFPRAVDTIEKNAVPIDELLPALRDDQEAASAEYGTRQGSSPYNFSTSGEGIAGTAESGTAIRDAVGFIEFGQFTNQVEYAGAATALNTEVKNRVLKGVDPSSLEGKRVSFLGAFTLLTPDVVTVTPVRLETAG
jgi:hypothetical protein